MSDPHSTYSIFSFVSEAFKYVMAGLLTLLWWDVRKVRSMREGIMKAIDDKYLPREHHDLMVLNAELKQDSLRVQETQEIKDWMQEKFDELKKTIEENGKK